MNTVSENVKSSTHTASIGALILAAGASRRLGTPKQLVRVDGVSLLRRTAQAVIGAGISRMLLVTGCRREEMELEVNDLPIETYYHKHWEEGQGSSLAMGLRQLVELNPEIDAALIALIDQPRLHAGHIIKMMEIYRPREACIVASGYAGTYGVPTLVDQCYFGEMYQLQGEHGGKKVLRKHEEQIIIVPFPEGDLDIDKQEDLKRL